MSKLPNLDDYSLDSVDDDPIDAEIRLDEPMDGFQVYDLAELQEEDEDNSLDVEEKVWHTQVMGPEGANIDWDDIQYNENGTFKFPMKLKFQPKHVGYGMCEKVPDEYKTGKAGQRTNERCYICDRSSHPKAQGSTYTNSTTEGGMGGNVYIQPDGRPVCTSCMRLAKMTAAELSRDTEILGRSITPEGARAVLENQINKWRLEDLEKERRLKASNLSHTDDV